jgi:uncharacterized protein with PIN domain
MLTSSQEGHDASWHDGIDEGELVRLCHAGGRTVLSSDEDIFGYALVRDGVVPSLFVPRGVPVQGQLAHVLRELGLPLREPRWRRAGRADQGRCRRGVPLRSLACHDRFWACVRCGKAFWHGTHLGRIAERLAQAAGGTR